jgi:tRNA-binding EMAP/Myf-like protein
VQAEKAEKGQQNPLIHKVSMDFKTFRKIIERNGIRLGRIEKVFENAESRKILVGYYEGNRVGYATFKVEGGSRSSVVILANPMHATQLALDVNRLGLVVGAVRSLEPLSGVTKPLLLAKVDIGARTLKIITESLEKNLVGKGVVVVSKMKPKRIMNELSEAMILGAVDESGPHLVVFDNPEVPLGAEVVFKPSIDKPSCYIMGTIKAGCFVIPVFSERISLGAEIC